MVFDYKQAIKRIRTEELKGNNPIPDILSFLHLKPLYEEKIPEILDGLFAVCESARRTPESLLRIDIPKPNFTIRPMSRPENKDWFLYEAIVDFITHQILDNGEHICKRSFSFLNLFQTKGTNNWIRFDDKCREVYTSGYKYAVAADLTGYYENISLSELRKRIFNYMPATDENNNKAISVLLKLLNKWSDERVSGYGLPQGPPASSFLADIYLDYVDSQMEKYENYYRYMDDIRIFCRTEIEAKKALKDLVTSLRSIKLNINAKKTRILSGKDIEARLFDPLKPSLNLIEAILKGQNEEQINAIIPSLVNIFENSFLDDPFEKSHLNFSLYRLGVLQSSNIKIDTTKIISLIKDNFIAKPHHTGLFCFFLTLFPSDKNIFDFLISFLQSEDNIYEWQEIKVLQSLLRFKVKPSLQEINFFIEAAKNYNKHYAARAFYLLLIGKQGTNRDRELIVDIYRNDLSLYVKIAIILAVQGLGHASRSDFYARIKRIETDIEIIKFIDYVKSLKQPLYYLDIEKPKLEGLEVRAPSPY
jgi:hypothetical protein